MAYFDDLSLYSYIERHKLPKLFNIGWLDRAHSIRFDSVPVEFKELLGAYGEAGVAQTRGFHECELCKAPQVPLVKGDLKLGSAEIRVFGQNGIIYAAPNLIIHYVEVHGYCPPQCFINSVLGSDGPPNTAYFQRLESAGISSMPCRRK